jgi:hypothetical protein
VKEDNEKRGRNKPQEKVGRTFELAGVESLISRLS